MRVDRTPKMMGFRRLPQLKRLSQFMGLCCKGYLALAGESYRKQAVTIIMAG